MIRNHRTGERASRFRRSVTLISALALFWGVDPADPASAAPPAVQITVTPSGGVPESTPPDGRSALTAVVAPAPSAQTPVAAINSSTAHAASYGVTSYISIVDRKTGKVVAETANANTQVASASIMKLFLAAYYAVQAGGYSHLSASLRGSLEYMIKYSDDSTASQLFTASAIPSMAGRYGLSRTANAFNVGHWGAARITAHDMSKFLYLADNDPLVGPWLIPLMAQTNALGSDGFNQKFGFNALTGTHGSKQGWSSDNWTAQPNVIHSVGYTSRWFASVLQASTNSYAVMSNTATYSAQHIQASAIGTPPAAPMIPKTKADKYVRYLVKTLLNRPVKSSKYSLQLQQGKMTEQQVARAIVLGVEYRQRLVKRAYNTCLRRPPSAAKLKAYTDQLAKGTTASLYAALCSSSESRKLNGHGSFDSKVRNVFATLTGVPATNSQVASLLKTMYKSGWKVMITQIVGSIRWRTTRLNSLYLTMLDRPVTSVGRSRYLGSMATRGDFSTPIALAGSDEFWALSQK